MTKDLTTGKIMPILIRFTIDAVIVSLTTEYFQTVF